MKKLHLSILDTLSKYFSYDQSSKMASDVLEFGFKSSDILRFDIFDTVSDYLPEYQAKIIANEAISNLCANA